MRVRMNCTQRGCDDGATVQTHEAGEVYELGYDLGMVYVREGWASVEPLPAPSAAIVAPPEVVAAAAPRDKKAAPPRKRKAVQPNAKKSAGKKK